MSKKPYYITTAIAYTSKKPHIGNTYEVVFTDAIARFKRMLGYDVFFLTGTDEHGQKIEELAQQEGITPKEHVDKVAGEIREICDLMNTSYDKFIRTTDEKSCTTREISISPSMRVCTVPRARASGHRASWWTGSAPTAVVR